MWRLIVAVLMLAVVGMSVGAQDEAPVTKLFEISISDHYESIENVKWSPDGRYVAAHVETHPQADGQTWRFWNIYDVVSGEQINSSALLIWYADGQRALISNDTSKPTSWDLRTGEVFSLRHSPESTQHYRHDELIYGDITLLESGTLYVYDSTDGTFKFTRSDVKTRPMYYPDQTHAAIETSEGIELYETAAWTLIESLPEYTLHMPWLEMPIWSGDNQHLIVSKGAYRLAFHPTYIWTVGEGLSAPIYNATGQVWWLADDAEIVTVSDYSMLRFYDGATGELLRTVRGFPAGMMQLLDVTDKYLVTLHGQQAMEPTSVVVLSLETFTPVLTAPIGYGAAFIEDDRLFVTEPGPPGFTMEYDLTGQNAPVRHDD
jgi:hypothetical protein